MREWVNSSGAAIAARVMFVCLGCAAVVWGATCLPWVSRQLAIERIATNIIYGEPFKSEILAGLLPELEKIENDGHCRPAALRSAAVVRLRWAEDAISAGEQQLIDPGLDDLDRSIRRSLACSPSDPFSWLVLFWVESARHGFRKQHLAYLSMSYRLSMNEAWIGLKRVQLTLAVLPQLSPDLVEAVLKEFTGLVNSGYYMQMAQIFSRMDPAVAKLVLARVGSTNLRDREGFARELYRQGYEVSLPGVVLPAARPWH